MSSFLDELRATEQHIRAQASKTLEIPGRGGLLAVRYRPPEDRDALTSVQATLSVQGALSPEEELQLIVACCDEILHRDGDELVGYDPPLRFDAGDERWEGVKSAREAAAKLFAVDVQPLAPARHVGSLIDWLQGMDAEISARVEGKSGSTAASSETPPDSS